MTYEFEVADPAAEVQRLQTLLEDHRLRVEAVTSVQGFRVTESADYGITVSILRGRLRVNVGLMNGIPDAQAEEVLQPVINAIGSRS